MNSAASAPPLELVCFGPPVVRLGGAEPPADVVWRKNLALLAYLALSPERRRSREHLLGLLWPEKPESQSRHSLSEALRRMRASLGVARLQADGETIVLDPAGLSVDAATFDATVSAEPGRALSLYQGDFLDGLTLTDAPAFDEWVTARRARYRSLAADAAIACGEQALIRMAFAEAADLARRAQSLDALAEAPVRLLMRARALGGDSGSAGAAFHQYQERLRAELGESPGRELAALAGRLREGRWRRQRAAEDAETPFVGSGPGATTALREAAAAIEQGPRVLLVSGGPGMGKSRLLAECLQRSALDGAAGVIARPLPADVDASWSTLRQLFRQLATAPGVMAADADALSIVAGFAPLVAQRVAPREAGDVAQVAAALAAVMAAVADEQPLVIMLDDAHLADERSLAALRAAIESLRAVPVLVALAAPEDLDQAPAELLALVRAIGNSLPGAVARLDPLCAADAERLIRALVPGEQPADVERLVRRLMHETGGGPYWLVLLLKGLQASATLRNDMLAWPPQTRTFDAPLPSGVPGLARLAVSALLVGLGTAERAVVIAAAVADGAWTPALLAAATGQEAAAIEQILVELERTQLLSYVQGRFMFTAPVFAAVVRDACLSSGERERVRGRVIAALEAQGDELDTRVRILELRAERGPDAAVGQAAAGCVREALGAGSSRAAGRALRAAEAAVHLSDAAAQRELADLRDALKEARSLPN